MDKARGVTCELCGGTEFYKETGFYYCKECQTQTREIQEHAFELTQDEQQPETFKKITRKRNKSKEKKVEEKFTSWECYNHVLLGIVNELMDLGASKNLKATVRMLWFRYLERLQVINTTCPPKLPAVNSHHDAEVIYGRKIKKKRRRSTSGSSSSDDTQYQPSSSARSARSKLKALSQAEYSELESKRSQETSLANQSLQTLKGSSDPGKKADKYLHYNKYATKELLKQMSRNHLLDHRRDINSEMDCHRKLTYREVTASHEKSPTIITRGKLYGLIYLALLICKDDIQLGDLMRYVREMHVSYSSVLHFIPEELSAKKLSTDIQKPMFLVLTHQGLRSISARLTHLLNITHLIPAQNLVRLCERYCKELNLPEAVHECCLKLMAYATPKMRWTSGTMYAPNYEGRAMSFILFTLKLLYGLDDVTEHKFSKYAAVLNSELRSPKMFVFDDWLEYVEYRKLVIKDFHFPTQTSLSKDVEDPRLFLNFLTDLKDRRNEMFETRKEHDFFEGFLKKMNDLSETPTNKTYLQFPASLTPFREYIDVILKSNSLELQKYALNILKRKFHNASLDYLLRPNNYLHLINGKKTGIKHGGANSNIQFVEPLDPLLKRQRRLTKRKRLLLVKITDDAPMPVKTASVAPATDESLTARLLNDFKQRHRNVYKENKLHTQKVSQAVEVQVREGDRRKSSEYTTHYNPDERHWLIADDVFNMNREEYRNFLERFPRTFRLILRECSRILEQKDKELLQEFINVEVYMGYVCKYGSHKCTEPIVDSCLRKLVANATYFW